MKSLVLDGQQLTLEEAAAAARGGVTVKLSSQARKRVQQARAWIDAAIREKKIVYGVTTGFGAFSEVLISREQGRLLQKNILMSHAAGVGPALPSEVVRGVMLLMINGKARGNSGMRWSTLDTLRKVLNADIVPVVPEQGSVGASGDLAPLAHLSLVLIGKGRARYRGKTLSGSQALKRAGLAPVALAEGEGLALINGTQVMTAIGALTLHGAFALAKLLDIAAAMSLEVLLGSKTQFHKRIHQLRPHPGQIDSAANMRRVTDGSEIISSHKDCGRVQDAYSLRCVPQVHGASRDTLAYVRRVIETEMNSSTENPLVFPNGQVMSGGNFHGQPVALAMDYLAIAMAEFAGIAERRIERMVNPNLSGLPSFLVEEGGLNSGFMIAQYTAAALVSENKVLAHPASVDSIPTSANKEDHVSMGTIAARKARQVVENVKQVAAIELLCAAQALDLFTNLKPGKGTLAAYQVIRRHVRHLKRDRELNPDIETVAALIDNGDILTAVEKVTGPLL
ncbi:MAG: histidine ammonia-lyase [Nitrospinaceae bacterium]|nr:histidine ammonia-lyase [Nitrospinaceae bacterium]NIR53866.1 histidine ammonia-lyase [Nitrospinaceae bacterium]NIS84280.1 histidine ammonia-lyase [Nitrospinaceae bacterium]NIT81087.1 histidine ammonia-lyase [Nitrospinaceae bacterium]NIU43369.1 histidine ammonia-lyase [Nitrospinaceae bacterium]